MNLRISRCMAMICLVGSCQLIRTLPETVPLDFSCQAQIEYPTLYASNQPPTKITLTLTPNNAGTQASSLTLTDWSLPEGMNGLLLDSAGKAVTSDTPLSWGAHTWHYSPVGIGAHTITLHLSDPYAEEPRLIALPPIEVLAPEEVETGGHPSPISVSAWMRALTETEQGQVHGIGQEVVALELRLEAMAPSLPDTSFKLQRWQLPEGISGTLQNTAGERLNTFPLRAGAANTLFLWLDSGHQLQEQEEPLRLWVQGPHGMSIEKTVPLHWQQPSFPFDLSLALDRTTLFSHQALPIILKITPKNPQQQTEYRVTTLTLSHGVLKGAISGVELTPGALLTAGEQRFLFACSDGDITTETRVRIEVSVSNMQGDSRSVEQVLVVRPVHFAVSAWMRALTEKEEGQVGRRDKDVVALELRLEDIPPTLEAGPFNLQRWQLPEGISGTLQNTAGERLNTFPLRTGEANTLFLWLDSGHQLQEQE